MSSLLYMPFIKQELPKLPEINCRNYANAYSVENFKTSFGGTMIMPDFFLKKINK